MSGMKKRDGRMQSMARTVAIGIQDFEKMIINDCFYVDKTLFIREWWESADDVTLITRPRRFGKTLNMSMLEYFFSVKYAKRGELFKELSIWKEQKYRELQGTYPVISLSFAAVKENNYPATRKKINGILANLYVQNAFLRDSGVLEQQELEYFNRVSDGMDEVDASMSLHRMSDYLQRYYKKKVIILLDEYDTPMQEAYVNGYWDELVAFTRSLFNATFKTNPYLERAIMTGITRVSKESIFSDLNNLKVVTTTSNEYAMAFGFTEQEVFAAMDELGYDQKDEVKKWYDGFTFGNVTDIYNPWSILNYLDTGNLTVYWANTSGNALVSSLIRSGNPDIKMEFEELLSGGSLHKSFDEQIVYSQLYEDEGAIWSLLVASGYLKLENAVVRECTDGDLRLTNREVQIMFRNMVKSWFTKDSRSYNELIKALLWDDIDAMNEYMNRVTESIFSSFDTGKNPSRTEPERFYHGFVLGLMVDLRDRYVITSNRESGFGRYDIMLEPRKEEDAIIIEFKVINRRREDTVEETLAAALAQIEDKKYAQILIDKGIPAERIRKYGFAFDGKQVLIG
jgi:hypothetical protein